MATALPESSDSEFSEEDQTPLDLAFTKASNHVRKITSNIENNRLLELYGLYKQGTEGSCNIPKPGWLDGKGRKKWEAWRNIGDMSSDEAKQKYIDLVQSIDPDSELTPQTGSKETWVTVSSMRYSPEPDLIDNELSLFDAAREDMGERVEELLERNPELKGERDEDGLTALHWAADRDATKALTAAINGGCPIDAVDNYDQTALHYAVSCGHVRSTKILIDAGASFLKDDEGNTPLDLATDKEVRKILESSTK